jgi:hypothetical protein
MSIDWKLNEKYNVFNLSQLNHLLRFLKIDLESEFNFKVIINRVLINI